MKSSASAKAGTPSQGQLEVRTQFIGRGVALAERMAEWPKHRKSTYGAQIGEKLIADADEFIRDLLACFGEIV